MWAKIDVIIFALAIAEVTAMPSKRDDENEISVNPVDPCRASPCGANAICTVKDNVGSCPCLPEYFGNPYEGCRPESVLNSDCSLDRVFFFCIRNRCQDPCPGTCGIKAECQVINHYPVCSCSDKYTGNPFDSRNPIKSACLKNNDCSARLACLKEKCVDPCIGSCGENAVCEVLNHVPVCSCPQGWIGDPFLRCTTSGEEEALPLSLPSSPCLPSPCGPNSVCWSINGQAVCSCLPMYLGVPPNCKPECIVNTDCPSNFSCVNQKCIDPCPGLCGRNAKCNVFNHVPVCSCPQGRIGDPFLSCTTSGEGEALPLSLPSSPCSPSPCGPNSVCRSINGPAVCSCQPMYLGVPPNCRPECIVNTDCPSNFSCVNQKCIDPCPGLCGRNAKCNVLNHAPICSCSSDTSGNPFIGCKENAHPHIPEDKSENNKPLELID